MKFRLNKKWLEISEKRTLEEQNEFLEDSLSLVQAKPLNFWPIYFASSLFIVLFYIIDYTFTYKLMLGLMLLHLLAAIGNFNVTYNNFIKRWYK
jgi:hypothetical protein